jgi:hypothetical protein
MLVDGYVRVAQVRGRSRPQFISPSEQAGQIRDWAALHGYTVANVCAPETHAEAAWAR